jgi:putative ABC transport system permease protein
MATTFSAIATVTGRSLTISDGAGDPERFLGAAVSWHLFPMLGTAPVVGQGFTDNDDRPGAPGVVLLSHRLWEARYESDPNIAGRTIRIDGRPFVVRGVMPPGFAFPENHRLWIPLSPLVHAQPRGQRGLFTFGRLQPGVSIEAATQDLDRVTVRLAAEYPDTNEGWGPRVRTLREVFLPGEVPVVISLMMAGVTLVLLIACSNVANLLLARATTRRRELAVRAALGAGRGRIVRQLLVESLALGLLAVPLGVVLALVGTRLMAAGIPTDQVPYYIQWSVDGRSLAYSIAIAAATALVFGLAPALRATSGSMQDGLKEGMRGTSVRRSRLRSALVVGQVALAMVALVGALLFVRTFANLGEAELGFQTAPLMTFRTAMAGEPYDVPDARLRRVEDLVRRIEAVPGVSAAFASNFIPLGGVGGGGPIAIEGGPTDPRDLSGISFIGVTPHLIETLDLPIVRGRTFTDAEGWSRTPVAIVSAELAARHWPDQDPIDRRFRLAGGGVDDWFRVVGVVRDARLFGIDPESEAQPEIAFVPHAYQQSLNTGFTVRVADGDPGSITTALRDLLRASDPTLAMFQTQTMDDLRRLSFWQYGLYGWVFGTIGVMGLLLASVGVYGVLAYSVTQRTQEIGVRMALGAGRRDVFRLVLKEGLILAGAGIAVGLLLAPAGTWLARTLLYQVSPFDPVSFAGVAALLVASALAASYVPARRAVGVAPMTALRE